MDKQQIKTILDNWGMWSRQSNICLGYPIKSSYLRELDTSPSTYDFTDEQGLIVEQALKFLRNYDVISYRVIFYYHVYRYSYNKIAVKMGRSKTSVMLDYSNAFNFIGGYLINNY